MVMSGFSGGAYNGPLAAPDDFKVAAEWATAGLLGLTADEAVRHVLYGGKTSEQVCRDLVFPRDLAPGFAQSAETVHPVDLAEMRELAGEGVALHEIAMRYRIGLADLRALRIAVAS